MSLKQVSRVQGSDRREFSGLSLKCATKYSAPGLVFWFADADAASQTTYPPTTFRWIDNQREAEEAVDAAKKRAEKRAAEGDSGDE